MREHGLETPETPRFLPIWHLLSNPFGPKPSERAVLGTIFATKIASKKCWARFSGCKSCPISVGHDFPGANRVQKALDTISQRKIVSNGGGATRRVVGKAGFSGTGALSVVAMAGFRGEIPGLAAARQGFPGFAGVMVGETLGSPGRRAPAAGERPEPRKPAVSALPPGVGFLLSISVTSGYSRHRGETVLSRSAAAGTCSVRPLWGTLPRRAVPGRFGGRGPAFTSRSAQRIGYGPEAQSGCPPPVIGGIYEAEWLLSIGEARKFNNFLASCGIRRRKFAF